MSVEVDLLEFVHTRLAVCDKAVAEVGPVGAHEHVTERRVLERVRAVMEGRYAPAGSAS